jgi:pimeloyl-ACP methyl ester carboxylesterase
VIKMTIKFQGQYAEVNGVRLHYVSKGEGKLIMFVHGFPEFWAEWENQLDAFGKDYQAVAVDMRGYNLSSKPEDVDAYHVTDLIEDLRSLAEHLGHDKFILVAHDWGGAVAWSFAMRHPQWLEKLIIINAPHAVVGKTYHYQCTPSGNICKGIVGKPRSTKSQRVYAPISITAGRASSV